MVEVPKLVAFTNEVEPVMVIVPSVAPMIVTLPVTVEVPTNVTLPVIDGIDAIVVLPVIVKESTPVAT